MATMIPARPDDRSDGGPDEQGDWGYELLLYGHEQILRATDNGVLVAFAVIAFQEIRGTEPLPHYNVGFGLLLFSVLMCAVVHFAMGSVYVGQAKTLIRKRKEIWRHRLSRGLNHAVAWTAGLVQLACILLGMTLVMVQNPPGWMKSYVLPLFQ